MPFNTVPLELLSVCDHSVMFYILISFNMTACHKRSLMEEVTGKPSCIYHSFIASTSLYAILGVDSKYEVFFIGGWGVCDHCVMFNILISFNLAACHKRRSQASQAASWSQPHLMYTYNHEVQNMKLSYTERS